MLSTQGIGTYFHLNIVKLKENFKDQGNIQIKLTFILEDPSVDESSSSYCSTDEQNFKNNC